METPSAREAAHINVTTAIESDPYWQEVRAEFVPLPKGGGVRRVSFAHGKTHVTVTIWTPTRVEITAAGPGAPRFVGSFASVGEAIEHVRNVVEGVRRW